MVDEMRRKGDAEGADTLLRIIVAIGEVRTPPTDAENGRKDRNPVHGSAAMPECSGTLGCDLIAKVAMRSLALAHALGPLDGVRRGLDIGRRLPHLLRHVRQAFALVVTRDLAEAPRHFTQRLRVVVHVWHRARPAPDNGCLYVSFLCGLTKGFAALVVLQSAEARA